MTISKQGINRRDILKLALASAGISALGPVGNLAFAAPDNRKFLVLVNLDGGNDSLNTTIPINRDAYFDRRPSIAVTNPLELNSGPGATSELGLHPNLPGLRALHAEGSLALVQKVGYPDANQSHFTSKDIFHTGDASSKNANDKSGWVARYAELYNNQTLGCVSIGYNAKALQSPNVNLMQVNSLSSMDYRTDGSFSGESQRRVDVARAMLDRFQGAGNSREVKKALQVGHENIDRIQAVIDNYQPNVDYPTNTRFSRSLESIAQLIQAGGLGTDIYYTGLGGFDTHSGQSSRHGNLMSALNGGIDALARDMKMMGKWDDCIIVVFSEFGRRNFENGSAGTDHGKGQTLLVTGGGVRGGDYGSSLSDNDIRVESNLPMEVDFRSVFGEVIDRHLGKDSTQVFTDSSQLSGPQPGFL
jgi:uncharacterized protein (DUF1501 family)